jgi:Arc/MetJ-type ribon-helix-helix transcriptional regulator
MTQIAVKLPNSLVAELDRMVSSGSFKSRSDAVRQALVRLVRGDEQRRIDDAFKEGFRRFPDTEEEQAEAMRLGIEAINEEPWERCCRR